MIYIYICPHHREEQGVCPRRQFDTCHHTRRPDQVAATTQHVNRTFKLRLRELWEEWITAGEHSFTKTGRMRRATYADVCGWVVTAWKHVNVSCIRSGKQKSTVHQTQIQTLIWTLKLLIKRTTCVLKSLHCFTVTAKTLRVSSLVSDLFTTYQLTLLNVYNMTIYNI